MEKLFNAKELADALGLTYNYVIGCCSTHPERLPRFFRINRSIRFKESDIEKWIEQKYKESA